MTITLTREEAQQVLDALETLAKYEHPEHKIQIRKQKNGGHIVTVYPHKLATNGAEILSARLSAPEPEPVAKVWCGCGDQIMPDDGAICGACEMASRAAPPQREWQSLTQEEIADIHYRIKMQGMGAYRTEDIYRAIEAKLREKNGNL